MGPPSLRLPAALAAAVAVLHVWLNGSYGYFRDELNYLACGERLAWGYVDHPPLVPALIQLSRMLLGDSLRAIRIVPALASGATVFLTALLARELGGNRFSLLLASIAALVPPIYLANGSFFTTNSLEPVFWTASVWCLMRAIRLGRGEYWLGFGAALGLGLEDKYSIGVFAAALVGGVLLSPARRQLFTRWFWAGAGLAMVLFLPNLLWNQIHGWPFFELMGNIRASGRDVVLTPAQFLVEQILLMHPFTLPIWISGLGALLLLPRWRPYAGLGWAYLLTLGFFLFSHGKNYYLAPVYPMLFAAGSVVIAEKFASSWARGVLVAILVAGGCLTAPLTLPVLPVPKLISYLDAMPFDVPRTEVSHTAQLPQHYADQFGWPELAGLAGRTWQQLPEADRADCPFFGQNYGQAGAIDFFGRRYGLPPALSGHQTYFLWGPRGHSGKCVLVAGDRREVLERYFEEVTYAGSTDVPYALEGKIPLFVCRRLRSGDLAAFWPQLKKWR